jgi:hypothetical protein
MLEEWKPMVFEVFPWKTTRTYIVRKTDAIMTLLDEQIVKTQVRHWRLIGPEDESGDVSPPLTVSRIIRFFTALAISG